VSASGAAIALAKNLPLGRPLSDPLDQTTTTTPGALIARAEAHRLFAAIGMTGFLPNLRPG